MIDYLNQISAGEVKTLLCADMVEVLADLESSKVSQSLDFTIVTQSWTVLPITRIRMVAISFNN
jgi:hypothetical protein